MLTLSYLYPIWWLLRVIFVLFYLPKKQNKNIFNTKLFFLVLGGTPISYAMCYFSGYLFYFQYETIFVLLVLQILLFFHIDENIIPQYYLFIFSLQTIGPFYKFIFGIIHHLESSTLLYIPSILDIITTPDDFYQRNFVLIFYPIFFIGLAKWKIIE